MHVTPENVKNLLNTLFVHDYEDLIIDFDVILRKRTFGQPRSYGDSGIGVDVIMDKDKRYEYNVAYDIEGEIEKQIRGILKYLGPGFVVVDFYVK